MARILLQRSMPGAATAWGLFLLLACTGCRSTVEATFHESERMDEAGISVLREAQDLAAKGNRSRAKALLRDLVRAHPDFFRAYRALQDVVIATDGVEAARAESLAAKERDPSPLNLTLLARVTEKEDEARPLLEKAVEADPSYVWAHYGLAYLILKGRGTEAYEKARRHLEEALARSSAFHEARKLLIECLRRIGDTGAEKDQYLIYLSFNPDDLDMRYNYADLLLRRLDDLAVFQEGNAPDNDPDNLHRPRRRIGSMRSCSRRPSSTAWRSTTRRNRSISTFPVNIRTRT